MITRRSLTTLGALALAACGGPRDGDEPAPEVPTTPGSPVDDTDTTGQTDEPVLPTYEVLDPVRHLVRASMDLRGTRPSIADIEAVEADPGRLEELVRGYVADEAFPRRLSAIFAEVFQTRHEDFYVILDYYEDRFTYEALSRSIGEEPLQTLAHIAENDLPITELVTGDWTMANDTLAQIWPVEYPEGETGWRRSRYTDGRPAAGVLAQNGMWWQFGSMEGNLNRGRANQVSRIMLCYDYLDLQVDFGTDQPLDSAEALGDAVRVDPNCTVCHDTLDPLGSNFFGFWYFAGRKNAPFDMDVYHPDREREWATYDSLPPGLNGKPTAGLADLGRMIAAEPRFAQCWVEHGWRAMLRRDVEPAEEILTAQLTASFTDQGMRLRPLFEALALSDAFAEGTGEHGRKLVDPALLSAMIHDLTGYRLIRDSWDLLRAPYLGYFALAGGLDGRHRFEIMPEPATTFLLVNKRVAEAAATHVVDTELGHPESARLLTLVDGTETLDEDRDLLLAQLRQLHLQILSERPSEADPDLEEELRIWGDLTAQTGDAATAWKAVISLLLRDPDFVTY